MDKSKFETYIEIRDQIETEAEELLKRYEKFLVEFNLMHVDRAAKYLRNLSFHDVSSDDVMYEDYDGDISLRLSTQLLYTENWEPIEFGRIMAERAEEERLKNARAAEDAKRIEEQERAYLARLKEKYEGESGG